MVKEQVTWERLEREWPDLTQLLGGYLHQDWDLDAPTPDDALRDAAREGQGDEQVAGAIQQIDALLTSGYDEASLTAIVERMTAGYSPVLDGWKTRDWLEHAKAILGGSG